MTTVSGTMVITCCPDAPGGWMLSSPSMHPAALSCDNKGRTCSATVMDSERERDVAKLASL